MRLTIVLCLALCFSGAAFSECRSPQYRTGATFLDDPQAVVKNISIPLREFAPDKLVCLAAHFRQRYPGRDITINFFSSHRAAASSSFIQFEGTEEGGDMLVQMHAQYVFDSGKHEEYLFILPAGAIPWGAIASAERAPYATRIDLPVSSAPHCRLEIDNRCLIALEIIFYPEEALKMRTSGAVTLAAMIARDGRIDHVRVVKVAPASVEEKTLLANAAAKNLSSWRVEPGTRPEQIQITYSYEIDTSLSNQGQTEVDWGLPDKVTVKGRPRE
jgi:TonB family protein